MSESHNSHTDHMQAALLVFRVILHWEGDHLDRESLACATFSRYKPGCSEDKRHEFFVPLQA